MVEGTDNTIWYVNTKISKHTTSNRDLFVRFKGRFFINNEDQFLDSIPIHGVGEIELATNERIFSVPYVSYTPQININVLSLKQLILQGFKVEIKESKCVITHMCVDQDDQNETDLRINREDKQSSNKNKASTSTDEEKLEIEGN